jgi:hypothetical protein
MNRGEEVVHDIFPVLTGLHENPILGCGRGVLLFGAEVPDNSDDTEVL